MVVVVVVVVVAVVVVPILPHPPSAYAGFSGHDATVNLARSSLHPATIDTIATEVGGLTAGELECLNSWIAHYKKKYPLVGRIANNAGALELEPSNPRANDEGDCVVS